MIRWFCDLCGKEIEKPHNPARVRAYVAVKSRDDDSIGWSADEELDSVFAHSSCAEELGSRIIQAFKAIRVTW